MFDTNPLLQRGNLPPWTDIRAEHLAPAIDSLIADNRQAIAEIIASQSATPNWDDLVPAVDEINARLDEAMSIIQILSLVKQEDEAWEEESEKCSDAVAQYMPETLANHALFSAYQRLAESPPALNYDEPRKAVLNKILRRFRLAGIGLPNEQRQLLARLNRNIDVLRNLFLSNLDSASAAWSKRVDDVTQLRGLSAATLERLALNARQAGHEGWLMRLDQDTWSRVMAYAEDRSLREEYFIAYFTRASDQGPHAGQFDNGPVLELLLSLRHQKARLLGFENFAQLSLATEMAESTAQVTGFLRQQIMLTTPAIEKDADELNAFALERGLTEVQPWDLEFLCEQLRQRKIGGALKNLRAYFPLDGTLQRLCLFSEHMFGIQIVEQKVFSRWHHSVRLFQVCEHGSVIGYIYLDPFHRDEAPDYAWTATPSNRRLDAEGRLTLPIAVLYGNFTPGNAGTPCLLAQKDLRVLFHEFGHCLQHVLTRSPHHHLSGITQLGRDTAEFTGQLFELWCLSRDFLLWLAAHHHTGERLTEERVDAALAAIHTQTSRQTAELLMAALFDFELHRSQGDGRSVEQIFDAVQGEIPQMQLPSYCRFANSFDYMVTGYAASVYAYKWSGVLATEVFERFQKDWVFNPQTGREFREAFFSPGDSRSLLVALEEFLGQPLPDSFFNTPVTPPN
ncbi:M3 family metallopeptidase [Pseudomonas mandelii]|uniref:M3 family metallopeptidase n=1 Tax=Pseudomonas mandelii TaxID=75612 RepID=UPI00224B6551|nr:M3 family metallopeptidase [Pseudomonas mandelii]MCX2899070.1 M3 family metallopeptidase [Pseudomonas mandelii]